MNTGRSSVVIMASCLALQNMACAPFTCLGGDSGNGEIASKSGHMFVRPGMERGKVVEIAVIDSYNLVVIDAVTEELKAHGVVCYIEGSITYGVFVRQSDAVRAARVLRKSKSIGHVQVLPLEEKHRGTKGNNGERHK